MQLRVCMIYRVARQNNGTFLTTYSILSIFWDIFRSSESEEGRDFGCHFVRLLGTFSANTMPKCNVPSFFCGLEMKSQNLHCTSFFGGRSSW